MEGSSAPSDRMEIMVAQGFPSRRLISSVALQFLVLFRGGVAQLITLVINNFDNFSYYGRLPPLLMCASELLLHSSEFLTRLRRGSHVLTMDTVRKENT